MKIGDIDKNLAVESKLNLPDAVWFDVKEAPIEVHGLAICGKGDKFRRMPQDIADATNDGVKYLNTNTAADVSASARTRRTLPSRRSCPTTAPWRT